MTGFRDAFARTCLRNRSSCFRPVCPVILDFCFWRRSDRLAADAFFRGQGFTPEWHYVEVPDAVWRRNIADRNASAAADETAGYAVDAALAEKCSRVFETPAREEMDVWIVNMGET